MLPQAARDRRSVRGSPEPPDEDEDGEADFDTVGGLIIDRLGRIPAAGEDDAEYGGLEFTVLGSGGPESGQGKCTRARS